MLSPGIPFRLAVLNPAGRDPDQVFPEGAGRPDERQHPPVNYHAYAACTHGSFHREIRTIELDQWSVVVLLRKDLKVALKTVTELQAAGKQVAIAFKEAGSHQVASVLSDAKQIERFRELCAKADLCLASTEELVSVYRGGGASRVEFVPTPYPVDDSRWDFSIAQEERSGVLIGTREFNVQSRNHLAALLAAKQLGETVTVVNLDGRAGARILASLGFREGQLVVQEKRLAYPAYLKLIARHKIVFQLDHSSVPGQVAGDALLCRVPCIGGDGAIERIAFPDLCGFGRASSELLEVADLLLRSPRAYSAAVEQSQTIAMKRLSFGNVATELKNAFNKVEVI